MNRSANLRQRLEAYAQAGIWQDGLIEIMQARRSRPNDPELKKFWEQWLSLDGVALDRVKNTVDVRDAEPIVIANQPILFLDLEPVNQK